MESVDGFVMKDSGQREEFPTGSRRDTRQGKGRFDLLSPFVMTRDAVLLERGALKYGERNWEKGQPVSRFMDSAMRHLQRYMMGERDEDHLAAARWNIGAIMHMEEMVRRNLLEIDLFDIPDWRPLWHDEPSPEDVFVIPEPPEPKKKKKRRKKR